MSRIYYENISLKELVAREPLMVEAVFRKDPGESTEGHVFDVLGVLSPSTAEVLRTGQRIRVRSATTATWEILRRQYGNSDVKKSPIVSSLEGDDKTSKILEECQSEEKYLLFLRLGSRENEYYLAAEKAVVAPQRFNEFRDSEGLQWKGHAVDNGSAPVVMTGEREIYIDGLAAWPNKFLNKEISVTGLLVRRVYVPLNKAEQVPGGTKEDWVLENARWQLK